MELPRIQNPQRTKYTMLGLKKCQFYLHKCSNIAASREKTLKIAWKKSQKKKKIAKNKMYLQHSDLILIIYFYKCQKNRNGKRKT